MRRVAKQIVKISKIFKTVWGNDGRIRPVLASQVANPAIVEDQLNYINRYHGAPKQFIYGIAGAPYFGAYNVDYKNPALTVDQICDGLTVAADNIYKGSTNYHSLAIAYGVKSLCYEGGVDLGQADVAVDNKIKAQYDPRTGAAVEKYLTNWFKSGGDLFCYFSLCSTFKKWGYWGLTDDYTNTSQPKYAAAAKVAKSNGIILDNANAKKVGVTLTTSGSGAVRRDGGRIEGDNWVGLKAGYRAMYLLQAEKAGTYNLSLTTGGQGSAKLKVFVNGNEVSTYDTPNTGSWDKYEARSLGSVTLVKGLNGLRIDVVTPGTNFKSLTLQETSSSSSSKPPQPSSSSSSTPQSSSSSSSTPPCTDKPVRVTLETANGGKTTVETPNGAVIIVVWYESGKSKELV